MTASTTDGALTAPNIVASHALVTFNLVEPKRLGYFAVTSLRVGEVRFHVLARRGDAMRRVSRAEMRKVLTAAALAVDQLIRMWEVMHHE